MLSEGVAVPVLIGRDGCAAEGPWAEILGPDGIESIDGSASETIELAARKWRGLRRMGLKESRSLMAADALRRATALLHCGQADAMVAGARAPTAEVIRPSLELRRLGPGIGPVTSCFILSVPDCPFGEGGDFIFADCGLHPRPDPAMLARISIAAAEVGRDICGFTPRAALLSFSTKGSASDPGADAAKEAVALVRKKAPWLPVDGELQADAALVPAVARSKIGWGGAVAGKANILVFPDLASGNIAYKLVQRLAKARAVGPVFCGLNPPVNDLSRGCTVDDIVDMAAVSSLQARIQAD